MAIREITSFQDYKVSIGGRPVNDMTELMLDNGYLVQGRITPMGTPSSPDDEARGISEQNIINASLLFGRTRSKVRDALRAIVGFAFDRFQIPTSGGVDIGSGATGEMVEELLPQNINRSSWVQLEVNPSAVNENRRRHPGSTIVQGSYLHNIGENLNVVSSLSSLDATVFLDHAIERVRRALSRGGYLISVQDVRPGIGFGFREMKHQGCTPPYDVASLPTGLNGGLDPFVYLNPLTGQLTNVGECFRRGLGRALDDNKGMDVLMNEWVTVQRPVRDFSRWYFMNVLLTVDRSQTPTGCFLHETMPMEDVSAVVTVARRKV